MSGELRRAQLKAKWKPLNKPEHNWKDDIGVALIMVAIFVGGVVVVMGYGLWKR